MKKLIATVCIVFCSLDALAQVYPAKEVRTVLDKSIQGFTLDDDINPVVVPPQSKIEILEQPAGIPGWATLVRYNNQNIYIGNRMLAENSVSDEDVRRRVEAVTENQRRAIKGAGPAEYCEVPEQSRGTSLPKRDGNWTYGAAREFIKTADFGANDLEILPRSTWGAKAAGTNMDPMSANSVTGLVIHHAAMRESGRIFDVQHDHLNRVPPYADIGYHYILAPDPKTGVWKVYEGRSPKFQGAHAGTHSGTIQVVEGIVAIGGRAVDSGDIFETRSDGKKGRRLALLKSGRFYDPDNPSKEIAAPKGSVVYNANPRTLGVLIMGNYDPYTINNPTGYTSETPEQLRQPPPEALQLLGKVIEKSRQSFPNMKTLYAHGQGECAINPGHTQCPGAGCLHVVKGMRERFKMGVQ